MSILNKALFKSLELNLPWWPCKHRNCSVYWYFDFALKFISLWKNIFVKIYFWSCNSFNIYHFLHFYRPSQFICLMLLNIASSSWKISVLKPSLPSVLLRTSVLPSTGKMSIYQQSKCYHPLKQNTPYF